MQKPQVSLNWLAVPQLLGFEEIRRQNLEKSSKVGGSSFISFGIILYHYWSPPLCVCVLKINYAKTVVFKDFLGLFPDQITEDLVINWDILGKIIYLMKK